MKIQIYSDLHREGGDRDRELFGDEFKPLGDILILAGDIATAKSRTRVIDEFGESTVPVLYIPGNHEFYWGVLGAEVEDMRECYKHWDNIHVMSRDVFEYQDTVFIGCTLWTDLNVDPSKIGMIVDGLTDFRLVLGQSYERWQQNHELDLAFLKEAIPRYKATGKKVVVITHFAPSFSLSHPQWANSPIKTAFHCDLNDLIKETKPDLWIYGHTHDNIRSTIGETKIVCNQYGYRGIEAHVGFDPEYVVEI